MQRIMKDYPQNPRVLSDFCSVILESRLIIADKIKYVGMFLSKVGGTGRSGMVWRCFLIISFYFLFLFFLTLINVSLLQLL